MRAYFTGETKEALSRVPLRSRHCRLAELHGLILGIGEIEVLPGGRLSLLIQSENLPAVRRAEYLIYVLSGLEVDVSVFLGGRDRTPLYSLSLMGGRPLGRLLKALGFLSSRGALRDKALPAPEALLERDCCRRAYLRGAFLSSGYISDPGRAYHWELLCPGLARGEEVQGVLEKLGIRGRLTLRKGRDLLYVKDSGAISDLLNLMGATVSLLEWENARAFRSLQGQVNRQVNCETANLEKTTLASAQQRQAIRKIEEKQGLSSLPGPLREMALLRLEHPEASLTELGAMLDPPVGRSGINHRLRKLMKLAEELS